MPDCINAAHEYKVSKYQLLLSDLEAKSYTSRLVVVEIGALGHYLSRTCKSLNRAFPSIPKAAIRNLLDEVGKTAITASQRIFMARSEEIRGSPQPLPWFRLSVYLYIFFVFPLSYNLPLPSPCMLSANWNLVALGCSVTVFFVHFVQYE